jgi:SAM-dependent methyltransferase
MTASSSGAFATPHTARNRDPILAVLRPRLAEAARVLEVASGAGEHAVHVAAALPSVVWRPTDPDARALASIAAWREEAGLANVLPPIRLDAMDETTWPEGPYDALVCINMIHIAPWAATEGLMRLAGTRLAPGGRLFTYGPYREDGGFEAESNLAFDLDLRRRDPEWGVRDREAVTALAERNGLMFKERVEMPANNLILVFEKP